MTRQATVQADHDPNSSTSVITWDSFVGQAEIKQAMLGKIKEARALRRPLPHMLYCGPQKSGKVTLAFLLASSLGTTLQRTKATAITRPMDIMPFFTGAQEG